MQSVIDKLRQAADEARAKAEEMAGKKGEDGEDEDEEEGAGGAGEEEAEEEVASDGDAAPDAAGPSTSAAPSAAPAAAPAAPAAEEEEKAAPAPAAAAEAAAPAAAANGNGGGRYASEVAELLKSFPDFDEGLVVGLLEDQGGDAVEVAAYLKVGFFCCWGLLLLGSFKGAFWPVSASLAAAAAVAISPRILPLYLGSSPNTTTSSQTPKQTTNDSA